MIQPCLAKRTKSESLVPGGEWTANTDCGRLRLSATPSATALRNEVQGTQRLNEFLLAKLWFFHANKASSLPIPDRDGFVMGIAAQQFGCAPDSSPPPFGQHCLTKLPDTCWKTGCLLRTNLGAIVNVPHCRPNIYAFMGCPS